MRKRPDPASRAANRRSPRVARNRRASCPILACELADSVREPGEIGARSCGFRARVARIPARSRPDRVWSGTGLRSGAWHASEDRRPVSRGEVAWPCRGTQPVPHKPGPNRRVCPPQGCHQAGDADGYAPVGEEVLAELMAAADGTVMSRRGHADSRFALIGKGSGSDGAQRSSPGWRGGESAARRPRDAAQPYEVAVTHADDVIGGASCFPDLRRRRLGDEDRATRGCPGWHTGHGRGGSGVERATRTREWGDSRTGIGRLAGVRVPAHTEGAARGRRAGDSRSGNGRLAGAVSTQRVSCGGWG